MPLARRVTAERDSEVLGEERAGDLGGGVAGTVDDEEADAVHHRLETQGYRVGQGLVERYVCTLLGCVSLRALE